MSEETNLIELCAVDDVTPDLPFKADLNGVDVAVFQLGNNYYVLEDTCSHGPGSLSEGYVDGDEIECPFHQGKFNIITGLPTAPPCMVAQKSWKACMRGQKIYASLISNPIVS